MLIPARPPPLLPLDALPPPTPGDYLCALRAGERERVYLLHLHPGDQGAGARCRW